MIAIEASSIRVSYSRGYTIPLPNIHALPTAKHSALYRVLIEKHLVVPKNLQLWGASR